MRNLSLFFFVGVLLHASAFAQRPTFRFTGTVGMSPLPAQLHMYRPIFMDFVGPTCSVYCSPIPGNPPVPYSTFRDHRFFVMIQAPNGEFSRHEGYFAGDGQGGQFGNVWRVGLNPTQVGAHAYATYFNQSQNAALSTSDSVSGGLGPLNALTGRFHVHPATPGAEGFFAKGKLLYNAQGNYPKFSNGEAFVKTGVGSPENILAQASIEGTHQVNLNCPNPVLKVGNNLRPDLLHRFDGFNADPVIAAQYRNHSLDSLPTDPLWVNSQNGESSESLLGALNYLGSYKVNSVYAILNTLGGDGCDVFPWVENQGVPQFLEFDQKKLLRWDIVFTHAMRNGIALHLLFSESENENQTFFDPNEYNLSEPSLLKKVFMREMIARFGFYNVLWNMGEEVHTYSAPYVAAMTKFTSDLLGDHLDGRVDEIIKVHSLILRGVALTSGYDLYNQLLALPDNRMNTMSLQVLFQLVRPVALDFMTRYPQLRNETDEVGSIYGSVVWPGLAPGNAKEKFIRMWADLFSGVRGYEHYFAYYLDGEGGGDINTSTYSTRSVMWESIRSFQNLLSVLRIQDLNPVQNRLVGDHQAYEGGAVMATSNDSVVAAILTNSSQLQATIQVGQSNRCYLFRKYDPATPRWIGPSSLTWGGVVPIGSSGLLDPADPSVLVFVERPASLCL